ncbi:MAG TPA: hypothetical protein VN841_28420 [Bryobacteraceae bacterium]|nr:hypothetical protein [Bryobacteraceae bacterium]
MVENIVVTASIGLLGFYLFAWSKHFKTVRGHGLLDFVLGVLLSVLWAVYFALPMANLIATKRSGIAQPVAFEAGIVAICLFAWILVYMLAEDNLEDQKLRRLFKKPVSSPS